MTVNKNENLYRRNLDGSEGNLFQIWNAFFMPNPNQAKGINIELWHSLIWKPL